MAPGRLAPHCALGPAPHANCNSATLLGRETPELPAAFLFTALEIRVLQDLARHRSWEVPATLGATVLTLARLGGHLARNHDPPPGPTILWEGYSRLGERVATYETLRDLQLLADA